MKISFVKCRFKRASSRIIALCSFANFINSADRTILPISILQMTDQFSWSLHVQGWILSAFAIGYFTSQCLGSQIPKAFGLRTVLVSSISIWSLCTFITPLISDSLALLIACRIVLGLAEGLCLPTMFQMFANTISNDERSRAFGYMMAAGSVGQMVVSILCPHLQWQYSFYAFGSLGFIWVLIWLMMQPDQSLENADTLPLHATNESFSVWPKNWPVLLLSKPMIAIYTAHFAMNWSSYIIMQWLPTYLSRYLNADPHSLSFTALPFLLNSIVSVSSGHLADSLLDQKWSVLTVRRLMTTVGLIGPSLFLIAFCSVTKLHSAILFITLSMGIMACNSAGHLSNHVDIAPKYAGTTFAISNTIATVPGILCGHVTAELVTLFNNHWYPVFVLAAILNCIAALVYSTKSAAVPIV